MGTMEQVRPVKILCNVTERCSVVHLIWAEL